MHVRAGDSEEAPEIEGWACQSTVTLMLRFTQEGTKGCIFENISVQCTFCSR
jgi:hypothetical protein